MKSFIILVSLLVSFAAHAAVDLRARLSGPTLIDVDTVAQYQVIVDSVGSTAQTSTVLTVYLPMNSQLVQAPSICSLSAKYELKCNIGNFAANGLLYINFAVSVQAPHSGFGVSAVVSGKTAETATGNNTSKFNVRIRAPQNNAIAIVGPRNAKIDACTFSQAFTPNFESCTASSLTGYDLVLDSDFTAWIMGYQMGIWEQISQQDFHMLVQNGPNTIEYVGRAVSPSCFEGLVTYSNSTSRAAFRLCLR